MSVNTNVTVTFSEAMDATTVNDSTVELRDPANVKATANVTYDAATFTATLDPTGPLAGGVTYTAQVKGGGTDPRVKDVAGNALAANVTWTFTTSPQVVSTSPANGATGVPVNVAPTAKFSNALDPGTVDPTTVLLRDAANTPVPVNVSYDPDTFTVALVPTAPLQPGQGYTATLRGGATTPRIIDTMGQPLPADVSFSFMTALAGPGLTTFTVFTTQTPTNLSVDEGVPLELGMKFRASEDGFVTGVRFYKGTTSDNDTHIGRLWNITGGMPLGSVTIPDDLTIGWKQATFPTPIAITAGTNYVVSYLTPLGRYAGDNFYFGPSGPGADGVDNGPLRALSHIEAGGNPGGDLDGNGNGVFASGSMFPSSSFRATNYWVDVVFAPASQAPQVLSVTPAPGAAGIPVNVMPTAMFSEPLAAGSLTTDTVLLRTAGGTTVPISSVSFNSSTFTITILPQQDLQPGRAYTVILKGGATGPSITDAMGTPLAADYIWSFTTAP